jgi:hypothetical protein
MKSLKYKIDYDLGKGAHTSWLVVVPLVFMYVIVSLYILIFSGRDKLSGFNLRKCLDINTARIMRITGITKSFRKKERFCIICLHFR